MKKYLSQIHDLWFNLPEKLRFVFVGGFNSFVSLVMFICILHFIVLFYKIPLLYIHEWLTSSFIVFKFLNFHTFLRQISLALAWFLSSFISFSTQRLMVFRARGNSNIFKQYFKCLSTWFIGYLVNAFVLEIFASYFEKVNFLPPVIETDIAQAFALVLSAVVTYILFKYFAFKKKKTARSVLSDEYVDML